MSKKPPQLQVSNRTEPSQEELRKLINELVDNKQYDEALNYLNRLIEHKGESYYYGFRAFVFGKKAYDLRQSLHDMAKAFQDIEYALSMDHSERNLLIKRYLIVVGSELDSFFWHFFDIDYEANRIVRLRDTMQRNGTQPEGIKDVDQQRFLDLISDESYLHVLDELITLNPKAAYYQWRAQKILRMLMHHEKSFSGEYNVSLAQQDIQAALEIEPNAERYKIKVDIEIAAKMYSQALHSLEMAYENDLNQEEYLGEKYEILKKAGRLEACLELLDEWYNLTEDKDNVLDLKFFLFNDLKAYKEAIAVLDKMISTSMPSIVNPEIYLSTEVSDLSYARKLDILLQIQDYDSFAGLLHECFHKGLRMATAYYLNELIKNDQHSVLLKHFADKELANTIIMWFVACAYSALDRCKEASNLIKTINYDELYDAADGYFDIWNGKGLFNSCQLSRTDTVPLLVSAMRPSKMNSFLFLELVTHLVLPKRTIIDPREFPDIELNHDTDRAEYDDSYFLNLRAYCEYLNAIGNCQVKDDGLSYRISEIENKIMLIQSVDYNSAKLSPGAFEIMAAIERDLYKCKDNLHLESIHQAKIEERNRIIANLSHSIKNMLKAVIGPLQTLREEIPEKAAIIDNAIKGANLIREIVNAINLSFNTSMDELNWDVLKPGKDSMTLQDMIADSLKYSIGNMFDFRYFPVYAENYFPRSLGKADFEGITSEWNQAQSSIDMVKDFCDRHLFKLELDLDDSRDYHVGNEKSSAIKLMILFQEMIFNAVKYTSFIPLEERTVQISLTRHDDKLRLMVRNSYSEKVRAKTTGVGKLVIENFAKVLGCEPKITTKDNIYSIEMEFADIWRKHAQDSIH